MRKNMHPICAVLCAAVGLTAFAACGGGEDNSSAEAAAYTISVTSSDDYALTPSKTSARAGEEITVTAEGKSADVYIEGVTYNGTDCDGEDGTYTFTMPDENVMLAAVTGRYEEVLSDGGMSFDSENQRAIIKGSRSSNTFDEHTWNFIVNFNWPQTYAVSNRSEIYSSDREVIPDDAISYTTRSNSSGNGWLQYATISIDTSKVEVGSAYLIIYFRSNNSSSTDGRLCVLVTVSDKIELQTMKETVVIDFGDYAEPGEDVIVRLFDSDYVEGTVIDGEDAPSFLEFPGKVGEDGKMTVTFDYVVGHSYSINIFKGTEWGLSYEEPEKFLMITGDVVEDGSSATGFNQYVDGELSFITPDFTIELTVDATFEEVNNG